MGLSQKKGVPPAVLSSSCPLNYQTPHGLPEAPPAVPSGWCPVPARGSSGFETSKFLTDSNQLGMARGILFGKQTGFPGKMGHNTHLNQWNPSISEQAKKDAYMGVALCNLTPLWSQPPRMAFIVLGLPSCGLRLMSEETESQ